MASSSLYQIEKLDDKNFETWNVHMRSVLIHCGYWRYVNGDEKKNPTWEANKKLEWESIDEKALATIMLSVKSSQLNYIKNCLTSNDAWEKLKEVYKPNGPLQKVCLYKKLLNLNMKDYKNMADYLNTFSDITEKLADVGIQIQDELTVIILLSSLPIDYENFVVAMETRDALPSLSVLKLKLLEEAERREQRNDEMSSMSQAFGAIREGKGRKENNKSEENSKNIKGKCFVCGKKGHYANKCNEKRECHKSYSLVRIAKKTDVSISSTWVIDSGATSHMCSNRDLFTKFKECNDTIKLADEKSITAKAVGVVHIQVNGFEIELKDVLYSPDLQGNFLSVSKIVQYGGQVKFNSKGAIITDKGELVLKARQEKSLFVFDAKVTKDEDEINQYGDERQDTSVEFITFDGILNKEKTRTEPQFVEKAHDYTEETLNDDENCVVMEDLNINSSSKGKLSEGNGTVKHGSGMPSVIRSGKPGRSRKTIQNIEMKKKVSGDLEEAVTERHHNNVAF